MAFRKTHVVEARYYEHPAAPDASDFDAVYPVTILDAVIDRHTGERLPGILGRMRTEVLAGYFPTTADLEAGGDTSKMYVVLEDARMYAYTGGAWTAFGNVTLTPGPPGPKGDPGPEGPAGGGGGASTAVDVSVNFPSIPTVGGTVLAKNLQDLAYYTIPSPNIRGLTFLPHTITNDNPPCISVVTEDTANPGAFLEQKLYGSLTPGGVAGPDFSAIGQTVGRKWVDGRDIHQVTHVFDFVVSAGDVGGVAWDYSGMHYIGDLGGYVDVHHVDGSMPDMRRPASHLPWAYDPDAQTLGVEIENPAAADIAYSGCLTVEYVLAS